MEFSRQEYWSRLPCPALEDLCNSGIEPGSPALQADSSPLSHQGSPGLGGTGNNLSSNREANTSQSKKRASVLQTSWSHAESEALSTLPDSSCFLWSPSSISAFADGKWKFSGKWLSHSQTAKQPPRNSVESRPSASPVKGLIPKVADHEGLSFPRLLWRRHPASRCPLYLF